MTMNNVSGPNSHIPQFGHYVESPHTSPTIKRQVPRGAEAATEMINRKELLAKVDEFLCKEPQDSLAYKPYFLEKIRQNKTLLPSSPTEQDYIVLAHKIYSIYRREVIEKACLAVESNPKTWAFKNKEQWTAERPTFQDFMWQYSKMVYSGAPGSAIADVMKEEFPSLSKDFWPSINAVILPPEQEDFYPNS